MTKGGQPVTPTDSGLSALPYISHVLLLMSVMARGFWVCESQGVISSQGGGAGQRRAAQREKAAFENHRITEPHRLEKPSKDTKSYH